MSQDQVFVPWTRKEMGAPEFSPDGEDILGSTVSQKIKRELWEALGDSPIGASIQCVIYLVRESSPSSLSLGINIQSQLFSLPIKPAKSSGQTSEFFSGSPPSSPAASNGPSPSSSACISFLTFGKLNFLFGPAVHTNVKQTELRPCRVNHWLVLITFLQHTDPLIPHYRADIFNFQRGALSTLDRSLLGDLGPVMGWIAAHATNGISETHVLHHVTSKIPHYHAWEAADSLRKKLEGAGIYRQGAPGGWREVYRVMRECKFVEDTGSVVFYKNAYGVAAARPVFPVGMKDGNDSGVEFNE
ncbi:hypothetical protein DXG03_001607 [Asterophora parasitica]|uniref:Uncharacterized protein n=1 Tax=Asterophora parasitica TaxID=117018 RepID=A0A9P7KBH3_9AGAR|nr:hypothetical protein DXG03_001607 [Asterophora parasitica]